MSLVAQSNQLTRALIATTILRHDAVRAIDLADRLDEPKRTTDRLLASIREAGQQLRELGHPWYEVVTEVRGAQRYHHLVDHPAELRARKPASRASSR